ncbi:MAG: tetratricopeptide (TPR) repeat protein [Myxococcota bacterium]|jgi:tetratricopeptide (TPR) repeat protein
MGMVWAGTHIDSGLPVAVKVMSAQTGVDPAIFDAEIRATARLRHPHIVQVFDHGRVLADEATPHRAVGSSWLAMERITGGTLSDHRGRLDWPTLRGVLLRLLSALSHAHAYGVIHRDLKPSNVLLSEGLLDLRLMDFGLAAIQPRQPGIMHKGPPGGTPTYMAPEQIRGEWRMAGPWTDLYALGALAYALACGAYPYPGAIGEVLHGHLNTPPPELPPYAPGVDGFSAWIQRLMAKSPRDRFSSAAEAMDALPGGTPYRSAHRARPAGGLGLAALRDPPLAGRSRERDQLLQSLETVCQTGRAGVVVLRGPAGTGKTRLARWLSRQAHQDRGAALLFAAHSRIPGPHDGLRPALLRALQCDGLTREDADAHLDRRLGTATDEAARIERLDLILGGGRAERGARHAVLARVLDGLGPVAILHADDAQWGLEAMSLADWILGRRLPALVVLTVQEEATRELPEAAERITALQARDGCTTVSLSPLSGADCAALIRGMLALEPALLSAVTARAEGYPIYAVELLRDWAAQGLLQTGPGGLTLKEGVAVQLPEDLRSVWLGAVERALDGRPAADLAALELAAVLGNRVDTSEWKAVCQARGVAPSDGLLSDLVRRALLHPRPGGFRFTHGMLRESLEQQAATAGRLKAHHITAAEHLVDTPERAALHYLHAEATERALQPLLAAANTRRSEGNALQGRQLLDHYEAAIAALGLTDSRSVEGLRQRCWLEGSLGDPDAEFVVAQELLRRGQAGGFSSASCLAWLSISNAHRRKGRIHDALQAARSAEDIAAETSDPELLGQCAWEIGLCLTNRGDLVGALGNLQRAVKVTRRGNDPVLLAGTLLSLGYAQLHLDEVAAAEASILESETLYRANNVRVGAANCANARGELMRKRGDLIGAALAYRSAIEDHAGTSLVHIHRLNLGICLELCGDPAAALVTYQAVLPELLRLGLENLIGATHTLILPAAAALRDWQTFDVHAEAAEESLCTSGFVDHDIEEAADRAAVIAAPHSPRRANFARAIAALQRIQRQQ